jgi:hypothetical protein
MPKQHAVTHGSKLAQSRHRIEPVNEQIIECRPNNTPLAQLHNIFQRFVGQLDITLKTSQ